VIRIIVVIIVVEVAGIIRRPVIADEFAMLKAKLVNGTRVSKVLYVLQGGNLGLLRPMVPQQFLEN
jgi:hypothetical protein